MNIHTVPGGRHEQRRICCLLGGLESKQGGRGLDRKKIPLYRPQLVTGKSWRFPEGRLVLVIQATRSTPRSKAGARASQEAPPHPKCQRDVLIVHWQNLKINL